MATTFRSEIVAAIRAVFIARMNASPTLLRAVYNARPGAFPETPCAYIGPRDERIRFAGQTRTREFNGLTAVVVDSLPDASEEADRMDDLIDLLVDDFTAAVRVGGGLLQITSVSDADIVLNGAAGQQVTYRGAVLGFGDPSNPTFIQEGRA
jgi:hypothetical protein